MIDYVTRSELVAALEAVGFRALADALRRPAMDTRPVCIGCGSREPQETHRCPAMAPASPAPTPAPAEASEDVERWLAVIQPVAHMSGREIAVEVHAESARRERRLREKVNRASDDAVAQAFRVRELEAERQRAQDAAMERNDALDAVLGGESVAEVVEERDRLRRRVRELEEQWAREVSRRIAPVSADERARRGEGK